MNLAKVSKTIKVTLACAASFRKYLNEASRVKFVNAYLKTKLNNWAEFLIGDREKMKNKYHNLTMYLACWIKGTFCFKISCRKILKSINWETARQQILKKNLKLIHKVLKSEKSKNKYT